MDFKKTISLVTLAAMSLTAVGCNTTDDLVNVLPQEDVSALASKANRSGEVIPGEFIVKYKANAKNASGVVLNSVGAKRVADLNNLGAQVIKLDNPSTNASSVISKIASNPSVEWVEPNRITSLPKAIKDAIGKLLGKGKDLPLDAKPFTPNDAMFSQQYAHKVAQSELAWSLASANKKKQSVIAIIDTGVDGKHPDLAGKMLPGYDAYNTSDPSSADNDGQGHGTHCAGIAGAMTDNKIGVAGFSPDSKIISVKVLGDDGSGTYAAVADGIAWAAKSKADVLSMSLGGPSASQAITDAVNLAIKNGKIVFAAMGNDGNERPSYPAAINGVIAIGATDSNDKIARFSQYGKHTSLAAPGVGILSTFPTYSNGIGQTNYGSISGTSMACPAAAGLAGLLKSVNPSLTGKQLKEILESTADDLGDKGWDKYYGHGRINAYKALSKTIKNAR